MVVVAAAEDVVTKIDLCKTRLTAGFFIPIDDTLIICHILNRLLSGRIKFFYLWSLSIHFSANNSAPNSYLIKR